MVVRDFGEGYLFVALSALLVILVLILTELTASICAKTVKMAAVGQSHCMCLTTADCDDLLVVQSLNSSWIWLVGLVLCVLWQISNVIQSELS